MKLSDPTIMDKKNSPPQGDNSSLIGAMENVTKNKKAVANVAKALAIVNLLL